MHIQLTREESCQARRLFSISLCNLEEADLYWDPQGRRILARLVLAHYAPRKLPEDAVLIGTYHHGFSSLAFLDDLADVIAGLDWAERHQARAQGAQAASA